MKKDDDSLDPQSALEFERRLSSLMDKGELYFPKGVVYSDKDLIDAASEPDLAPNARPKSGGWRKLVEWTGVGSLPGWPIWQPIAAAFFIAVLSVWGLGLYPTTLSKIAYVPPSVSDANRSAVSAADDPFKPYYQGVEALRQAQFWMFRRVDLAKVDKSIQYLEEARAIAEARRQQAYIVVCDFYLGQAYLKKGDVVRARQQFEKVKNQAVTSDSVRQKKLDAEKILSTLDALERSQNR